MSRSYKKTPRCGDKKDKYFKKYANKRLRRKKLTHEFKHKSYKKDLCSYNICDYEQIGTTFTEYYSICVSNWYRWKKILKNDFPERDKKYQDYMRWFVRK